MTTKHDKDAALDAYVRLAERHQEKVRSIKERHFERYYELSAEEDMERWCLDGTVEKHAAANGVDYQSAFRELSHKGYEPLRKYRHGKQQGELRKSMVELGLADVDDEELPGRSVMSEEEEREAYGFSTTDVERRMKTTGVDLRTAMIELSEEQRTRHAEAEEERHERELYRSRIALGLEDA